MKAISPKRCALIANGKATVELSKTIPAVETPFKCYIYCTHGKEKLWVLKETERAFTPEKIASICAAKDVGETYKANGKVIGEFVCDSIEDFSKWQNDYPSLLRHINLYAGTNSDYKFIDGYLRGHKTGYSWHISDLKIYDDPKSLFQFHRCGAPDMASLYEELCEYCKATDYGRHSSYVCQSGYVSCEGRFCCNAYEQYLDENFSIVSPPKSWIYVEGLL